MEFTLKIAVFQVVSDIRILYVFYEEQHTYHYYY